MNSPLIILAGEDYSRGVIKVSAKIEKGINIDGSTFIVFTVIDVQGYIEISCPEKILTMSLFMINEAMRAEESTLKLEVDIVLIILKDLFTEGVINELREGGGRSNIIKLVSVCLKGVMFEGLRHSGRVTDLVAFNNWVGPFFHLELFLDHGSEKIS